jgi:hypothetical protein
MFTVSPPPRFHPHILTFEQSPTKRAQQQNSSTELVSLPTSHLTLRIKLNCLSARDGTCPDYISSHEPISIFEQNVSKEWQFVIRLELSLA